jgi:hypothetical protein
MFGRCFRTPFDLGRSRDAVRLIAALCFYLTSMRLCRSIQTDIRRNWNRHSSMRSQVIPISCKGQNTSRDLIFDFFQKNRVFQQPLLISPPISNCDIATHRANHPPPETDPLLLQSVAPGCTITFKKFWIRTLLLQLFVTTRRGDATRPRLSKELYSDKKKASAVTTDKSGCACPYGRRVQRGQRFAEKTTTRYSSRYSA